MEQNQNTGKELQPHEMTSTVLQESSELATSLTSLPVASEKEEPTAAQPETQNSKLETDSMEVHKHPHHVMHKKKWNEYLLEFFMLFLAVFLGFLAENFREHQVEKEKARQYLFSFYEDLKYDTIRINQLIEYDSEKINALKTMYNCYDTVSRDLHSTACMGQLIKHSRGNRGFVLTERTLQQLSNAGGYRLLNKEDADSIIAYQNQYYGYLDFQKTVFQNSQDNVRNTLNHIANFKVIAPFRLTTLSLANDTLEPQLTGPLFFTDDKQLINQWFNELALYLRTINSQLNNMRQLKDKARGLLLFYDHKYHFEKSGE